MVFDFDDTLMPDSTTALLESRGVDPTEFWTVHAPALVGRGYDPPLAYLRLILDRVGPGAPLGPLTNQDLVTFGSTLDGSFFPGLPELFDDLKELVKQYRDVDVEFYVISGGLEALISGSEIVKNHVDGYYGCQLDEDTELGYLRYVKRCVTFTEKTRYLFEINKGITPSDSRTKPHLVNARSDERRIPFDRMVFIGDGLTDVPCFSLIANGGGTVFGVFQPGAESAKQAFQRLLDTKRVSGLHSPDYRGTGDLGAMIRAAVETCAARIDLLREQPYA